MRFLSALLLAAGLTVAPMTYASATSPDPQVCTSTVPDQPAFDETVVDSPAIPGREAVTHVEYLFSHDDQGNDNSAKTRWEADPNWNAESNPNSHGWIRTDETRVVVDEPAVDAVPEVSHIVHHDATTKVVEVECNDPVVPPKPEPLVYHGTTVEADCDTQLVTTTESTTTIEYVLDPDTNTWVEGEPVETFETSTLPFDEEDAANCETDVVVPPSESVGTPASLDRGTPSDDDVLPNTGGLDLGSLGLLAGSLIVAGGAMLAGVAVARRRALR